METFNINKIKSQFLAEKFNSNQIFAIQCGEAFVERTSEKGAVLIKFRTQYGTLSAWFAPWMLWTDEQVDSYFDKKAQAVSRYEQLVAYAKKQGVKGRVSGLKTVSILKKLADAGIPKPDFA